MGASVGGVAGRALRSARIACGLTLREVGSISGGVFKPSAVAAYERGERMISLQRFSDLAMLYGIPPERLLAAVMEASRETRTGSAHIGASHDGPRPHRARRRDERG